MIKSKFLPFIGAALVTFGTSLSVQAARPTGEFQLWTNSAPGAIGSDPEDIPTLTPYFASSTKATGAAMIVCPGGGYAFLSSTYEGSDYARWLKDWGISAFVLKYRLGPDGYHHPAQMLDAQRAIRYVRAHASDWDLDPNRIGIIGSSAGGHLAATTLVHFDSGNAGSPDPIEQVSCRPDLGVLCYPVITMDDTYTHEGSKTNLLGTNVTNSALVEYLSCEKQVTTETPPTFLFHTEADSKVPYQNSTMFSAALASNAVPYELHLYPDGEHGTALGSSYGDTANYHPWTTECTRWLGEADFGLIDLGHIWLMGDSITYGAAAPASVPGGFRDPLYTNLIARGYVFKFKGTMTANSSARLVAANQTKHEGHSGYGIADFSFTNSSSIVYNYNGLYDEVTAWYNSFLNKPHMVLLLIGINDLNQRYDESGAPDRLDLLITRLFNLNPDFRILVSSLPDADSNNTYRHNPPNNDMSITVNDYNAGIASIVATRRALGQNIEFVDMHAGLTMADLSDGLHPNAGGYVKMANIWADAIEASPPAFTTNAISVTNGMVAMEATGAIGTSYSLWSSTNLTNQPATNAWTLMSYGNITTNPFTITDPATNSVQFYRFSAP